MHVAETPEDHTLAGMRHIDMRVGRPRWREDVLCLCTTIQLVKKAPARAFTLYHKGLHHLTLGIREVIATSRA